jgi:GT2 family glycosyltransferase/glycosyltransferase involved in cell wall biosynthesis
MAAVLMISYSGSLGGAERALIDFAAALEDDRWLACPEGPLAARARADGIRVFALADRPLDLRAGAAGRLRAAVRLAAFRSEARALVRDLEPSLVIASGMRAALAVLLPAPAWQAPPVVFTHHDLLPGPLIGRLVRSAAARATLVVVPSRTVALDLGPRVPAIVVHPGVDVERFASTPGGPAQPPHAVVLGALVDWKDPELALTALALARRQRADLRLRIVGAPLAADGVALAERLRARASRPDLAGAVDLVGAVGDPAPELAAATCLLHCAPREPFGLAVVEALAAGRPVIAPAAGGPAEVLDESCALLYPPGDAPAAARALVAVLDDPELAARLGTAGRARARERFGVAAARERFAAALAPLARPRRRFIGSADASGVPLALVTVTHNSADDLKKLLRSVARHLPRVRVVVVDCASSDDTLEVARGHAVELIALEDNIGFGRACNRGVGAVGEPVCALVNPDVELVDDSLLELAEEAMRTDRLLAPLVLSPDGSRQDTVHPAPTSLADLLAAVVPGAVLAPWRSNEPRRVGWAVGCALVARTETLAGLGPFDEQIFLYGEDLDLGLRAAKAGVETWFWPSARVLHARAHSTSAAFGCEPFELLARARRDAVARRLGPRRARLDDAAQAVTFGSRIALKRALGRPAARERRQREALLSARRSP